VPLFLRTNVFNGVTMGLRPTKSNEDVSGALLPNLSARSLAVAVRLLILRRWNCLVVLPLRFTGVQVIPI
jgi:hypothetical protein